MTSHIARGAHGASRASLRVSSETCMAECESVVPVSFIVLRSANARG